MFEQTKIIGFHFDEQKQEIYVAYRKPSGIILASHPIQLTLDIVQENVYGIKDGKLTKMRQISKHIPANVNIPYVYE